MNTAVASNRASFGLRNQTRHSKSLVGIDQRSHAGIDHELLGLYIERNVPSYLATLVKMQANDPDANRRVIDFCWPAFLVTVPWLLYRKQWGAAAVLMLLPMVITYLLGTDVIGSGTSLGVLFAIALIGKSAYIQQAIRRIDRITREEPDPVRARERIRRTGGVSVAGAVLGAVITLVPLAIVVLTFAR